MLQKLCILQGEPRSADTDYECEGVGTNDVQQASDVARDSYCSGNCHLNPANNNYIPEGANHAGYSANKRGQQVSTYTYNEDT